MHCRRTTLCALRGGGALQVAVMDKAQGLRILTDEEVDVVVKAVEEEKAAAEAAKRGGAAGAGGAGAPA